MWIEAHRREICVQPVSPVVLYARDDHEMTELSPPYASALHHLKAQFLNLIHAPPEESLMLIIRLFTGPAPTVRSGRRVSDRAGQRRTAHTI